MLLIVIIFIVILITFFVFNDKGLLSRAKLEKENKELIEKIKQDSLEGVKLDNEINELKTSDKKT